MQTLPDEPHQPLVGDPAAEHLHQNLAVDFVEEGHNVCLHNVVRVSSPDHPVEPADRVVRAASRPKAVRAVQEVLLVDCLQNVAQRTLHDLVLDRRYPDRSSRSILLRDVHAADRLMTVLPRLHASS